MRFAWIFIVVLAAYWCSENTDPLQIDPEHISVDFEQIPGCLNNQFIKTGVRDSSRFYYDFQQNLELELVLQANCCPDSNRFDHLTEVRQDTIFFTVLDTAQNLCNCICDYVVQTEISGLLKDAYVLQCVYNSETIIDTLVYRSFD